MYELDYITDLLMKYILAPGAQNLYAVLAPKAADLLWVVQCKLIRLPLIKAIASTYLTKFRCKVSPFLRV